MISSQLLIYLFKLLLVSILKDESSILVSHKSKIRRCAAMREVEGGVFNFELRHSRERENCALILVKAVPVVVMCETVHVDWDLA